MQEISMYCTECDEWIMDYDDDMKCNKCGNSVFTANANKDVQPDIYYVGKA